VRILLLTQVVPYPPDSGPKVKTYHVLRYLAERHEVHLLTFARSDAEVEAAGQLDRWCKSITPVPLRRSRSTDVRYLLRSLRTGRPFLVERDDLPEMRQAMHTVSTHHEFDAIHADQLTMGQYALQGRAPLRVLDEHNAVWTIVRRAAEREQSPLRRALAAREWRLLRTYEGSLCRQFDLVTAVSDEDRRYLETAARSTFPSRVIPIAVDVEALSFSPRPIGTRQIVSVATMYYPPNAEGVGWFAKSVFPLVRQRLPELEFVVVGSRPPASIRRLEGPGTGIRVAGYVADLDPLIAASGVMVVPVHSGSGIRVKILEAFARGIPVVSTRIGVEGIDVRDGEHLLVADTPRQFAEAVIALLRDSERANAIARAARSLVEARYDWRTALRALDEVYPSGDSSGGEAGA
jgi:polysaccharide biosynthesis protein PslH